MIRRPPEMRNDPTGMTDRPWLVAIAGASGSGKSTLARELARALGPERACVLALDAYYRDRAGFSPEERKGLDFDCPEAWETERLLRDLRALRRGCAIEVPAYDFATHTRMASSAFFQPRPIVFVEGIFALTLPGAEELFDLRVGLDLSLEECLARRIARDVRERGRDEASVREQFERQVVPSIQRWVGPSLSLANLRLDASAPVGEQVRRVREILPDFPVSDPAWPGELAGLARRMGDECLKERLHTQAGLWAGKTHQGEGLLVMERLFPVDRVISTVLKLCGLYGPGHRQAARVRVMRHRIASPRVPRDLDGFRLLQLSDLHLDLDAEIERGVLRALGEVGYDLAVITGDYRNSTHEDFSRAVAATARILPAFKTRVYGILGNHDFVEMVPALEAAGLPMLLNEGVLYQRGSAGLYLGGIDDPHFYKTHDLARVRARGGEEDGVFRILLAHSPEIYAETARFDLVLAGHTHGGQICLPGGIAVARMARCPGRLLAGMWNEGDVLGYTSPGTGCCGVPVRWFCPPEITLHEFHHADEVSTSRIPLHPTA